MAHCPPELLDDLGDVFAEVRAWPGVVEKTRGVFYLRGRPFLHFHLLGGGGRRADVKAGPDWVPIDLPRPVTPGRRRALLAELRRRHEERVEPVTRAKASTSPTRAGPASRSRPPGAWR